ncbi:MAG: hypothetical protein GTO04_06810, partial [Planctomycetales bacterium]|nr:hypothetical protein [Planctomycetales bacterium]
MRFWSPELDGERERLATFATELENTGSDQDNCFILICRRRRLGHNSWLHGATREGQTETAAWLSPADLKNLSLRAGDEVELQTKRARLKLPVIAVEDVA